MPRREAWRRRCPPPPAPLVRASGDRRSVLSVSRPPTAVPCPRLLQTESRSSARRSLFPPQRIGPTARAAKSGFARNHLAPFHNRQHTGQLRSLGLPFWTPVQDRCVRLFISSRRDARFGCHFEISLKLHCARYLRDLVPGLLGRWPALGTHSVAGFRPVTEPSTAAPTGRGRPCLRQFVNAAPLARIYRHLIIRVSRSIDPEKPTSCLRVILANPPDRIN
jgi:hypothetical protein